MICTDAVSSNVLRVCAPMNENLQGINYERNKMLFLPDAKPELGPIHLFGMYVISPLPLNFTQVEVYCRTRKIWFH